VEMFSKMFSSSFSILFSIFTLFSRGIGHTALQAVQKHAHFRYSGNALFCQAVFVCHWFLRSNSWFLCESDFLGALGTHYPPPPKAQKN
jgi:hypothetical protein